MTCPITSALTLLSEAAAIPGTVLCRADVETAAFLTGCDFGLLWDLILSPPAAA